MCLPWLEKFKPNQNSKTGAYLLPSKLSPLLNDYGNRKLEKKGRERFVICDQDFIQQHSSGWKYTASYVLAQQTVPGVFSQHCQSHFGRINFNYPVVNIIRDLQPDLWYANQTEHHISHVNTGGCLGLQTYALHWMLKANIVYALSLRNYLPQSEQSELVFSSWSILCSLDQFSIFLYFLSVVQNMWNSATKKCNCAVLQQSPGWGSVCELEPFLVAVPWSIAHLFSFSINRAILVYSQIFLP